MRRSLTLVLLLVPAAGAPVAATLAACGSDADPPAATSPDAASDARGASSSSSSSSSGGAGDPCAALAAGTDLEGCVPSFCRCADGTTTAAGGGCTPSCAFGCAQHGGTGTPVPRENVYATPACRAYCEKLFSLGCGEGARGTIERSVSDQCAFVRTAPEGGPYEAGAPTTCAEAARQNLECLVATGTFTCNATGFSIASTCRFAGEVYNDGCRR